MFNIISVTTVINNNGRQIIEYPVIEKLINNEGWEIVDTLPPFGSAADYVITFILSREKKPSRKKAT